MSSNRIMIVLFVVLLCAADGRAANLDSAAAQGAESAAGGPSALGKWDYTGKENNGTVWTGTLTIEKIDPSRFDAKQYLALCEVEVTSPDPNQGTRSVQAPCEYDRTTRAVSFKLLVATLHSYSAVLSSDGKSLTNGKWTESNGTRIARSGEWSAKLPAR